MVEIGREAAAGNAAQTALLTELESGAFYERWLCLLSCFGSRDGARTARFLSDASSLLRATALRLAAKVCDDRQATAALESLPRDAANRLLRWLGKAKRHAVMDAYLATRIERGEENFYPLLPFGSPDFAARNLDLITERAGGDGWKRLARRHPGLAADALTARAAMAERFDPRLLWQANLSLSLLAKSKPTRALEVAAALQPLAGLARLDLQQTALRCPDETVALLLQSGDRANIHLERRVERSEPARLTALLERFPDSLGITSVWLKRLPPERRAALYETFAPAWQDKDGAISAEVLALLPRAMRETEARRHLLLPALSVSLLRRLPYAAFLSWDEAKTTIQPFLQNPDAELRGAAHLALSVCVCYHRDRLPELLALLHARRNEQDPVRLAMLTGLSKLPPSVFQAEHLDALSEIVFDALAAADLSYATGAALQNRLVTLLPRHPAWAANKIAFTLEKFGRAAMGNLETRLADRDVERIAPELLPVLASWEQREREFDVILLARALGRRLKVFPGLAEILERIVRRTRNASLAVSALGLLVEHRREQVAALIPDLLRSDGSWATQAVVYGWLNQKRQDLLTPYLGRKAYSGRFSTGSTRFLLPITAGFARWTRTQRETFALTLAEVMRDTRRDNYGIFRAIEQFAALPDVSPAPLAALAAVDSKNLALRDAALRAMGRLDAGQGVPMLLDALADDRGRIAIYALRPALLEMPTERALDLLTAAPMERVTVAKEVIRLLGDLKTEGAYRRLLTLDAQDLHRDAKIALLRALWEHLERGETWPALERAAVSPDAAIAISVSRIPAERLSVDSQKRLVSLLAALLAHPDPQVRLSALERCASLPVADPERLLRTRLLLALNSRTEELVRAAANAVFATYFGEDAPVIGDALRQILPNRRALAVTTDALTAALMTNARLMAPTARAALAALESDPLTVKLQVKIAVLSLVWDELAFWLTGRAETRALHADALEITKQTLQYTAFRSDANEIERLEAALAGSSDRYLRWLALAALVQAAQMGGWTEARRERLRTYQADAAELVAEAAQFTFPPEIN